MGPSTEGGAAEAEIASHFKLYCQSTVERRRGIARGSEHGSKYTPLDGQSDVSSELP